MSLPTRGGALLVEYGGGASGTAKLLFYGKGAAGSSSLRDNRPRMLQKHEEVSKGKAAERGVVFLAVFFVWFLFLFLFLLLFVFLFWLP